jgi:uncharacterized membrane protein YjjP (DUF1212 family)
LTKDISDHDALLQLKQVLTEPQEWGSKTMVLGFTLAGCAAARFFGGGLPEILVAGVADLIVGFIMLLTRKRPARKSI